MKILLKLSYLGKDFCGYQVQPKKRTVQGELNRASFELFGFECDVTGCSRTDSGVHANTFCACITKKGESSLDTHIDIRKIPNALNAHLPCDISVRSAELVNDDFHPRYDVKYKEYIYRICNTAVRDPFEEGRAWHIPSPIMTDGDIERMNAAAAHFCGIHDFSAFMASGSAVESTVRNIKYAKVEKLGDTVIFTVAADGFLYNMVRILTGTLISVAREKISPDDIPKIIESRDRTKAGVTAPADGLYLNRVEY